ncbi:DNA polymerase III subunit alpha [Patescibacteria group bacterium]|nr:DNA polymerase III subunit alpha [Patescibacteria group bacterium]
MNGFSHLSAHSHYSLLDGLSQIDDLVKQAAFYGMPALALTDRNNLYGAMEFYKAAKKAGVKPILGVDADADIAGANNHIVFLAENETGYKNLLKLISKAQLSDQANPRVSSKIITEHGAGLIALIPDTALLGHGSEAVVEELRTALGKKNVYARLGWNDGREHMLRIAGVAKALSLPLVASDATYYMKPEDKNVRDIVRKIANPSAEADDGDRTFISQGVAEERFRDFPEALKNTAEIAERCNLELALGAWVFPKFPIDSGTTYDAELEKAARDGITRRGITPNEDFEKRLVYELSIISKKGYSPYFLTVSDLLSFARNNGILTTTRGSAAGSLVSYLTGITNVDPIAYKLPFERFLNPERPSAPDVDMDFADNKRDEMIAYAKKRYGDDAVAQIGTFGTMAARAAVRDVSRALGYPYGVGDRIAKMIPFGSQGFPMTIDRALEIEEDLKNLYQSDEDAEIIINTAKKIEGNARHISIHAAGIVIAPSAVTDFVPVQYDPHGQSVITQYEMHAVEDAGLLKFDFLGLKNLSVLGDAVERVEKRKGEKVDIENIPLDDEKVFAMLARGETEGVFQLGGSGVTHFLKDLKPTSIHDINAMVALYRPGPMESIPSYIQRKHNPALIEHIDPRMKDLLERSYGIITYQDDVLLTAITLAGYSWLEADNLRKAMGKKIPAEMEAQKEKFIDGCISYGKLTRYKAESIWKLIEPFAAYGFNKAHAASYGRVAYQTAYMKAHHTEDYMAALLTADSGNVETIAEHVTECERIGIRVLPPDVNESFETFTVITHGMIRFGLSSIKNFGDGAAKNIIDEREKNGKFKSLSDFLTRMSGSMANKRALEALIKTGVFDAFGTRGVLLGNIEHMLAYAKDSSAGPKNQSMLFALPTASAEIRLLPAPEAPRMDMLTWEKELLGIYVSGHPLDQFAIALRDFKGSIKVARAEERNNFPLAVAGVVETVKTIFTKKGDRMAFVTVADKEASLEGVAFPEVFKTYQTALTPGTCVLLKGKITRRNGTPSLLIEKIKNLTDSKT